MIKKSIIPLFFIICISLCFISMYSIPSLIINGKIEVLNKELPLSDKEILQINPKLLNRENYDFHKKVLIKRKFYRNGIFCYYKDDTIKNNTIYYKKE